MAETNGEILRQKEQATEKQKDDVKYLLSNSTTKHLSRIVYEEKDKSHLQGELFLDIDEITGEKRIKLNDKNNFIFTVDKELTPKDHALMDCINALFTEKIDYKTVKPDDLSVDVLNIDIDVKDYMLLCGKDEAYISNADNVKKFKKRYLSPSCENLFKLSISGKSSEGDFAGMHPFSVLVLAGKKIHAELGGAFAKQLINHRDSQKMLFDTSVIELAYNNQGSSRARDIAYLLSKKLYEQASMPNNIKNSEKGYLSLSVKKAVEAVKFYLNKDIKSPVKNIINPIFEALEILADKKIIDYCFSGKNKQRLNDMETQKVLSCYETFINSYICYKVIKFNTEETKQRLIAEKIIKIEKKNSKGRPKVDHNKVYEAPKE